MLIVERPRWHHRQERQRRAAQPDVQCLVDVLRAEADEEGDGAGEGEEGVGEEVGEALAFEVLKGGWLVGARLWGVKWEGGGYDFAFPDAAGLIEELIHGVVYQGLISLESVVLKLLFARIGRTMWKSGD